MELAAAIFVSGAAAFGAISAAALALAARHARIDRHAAPFGWTLTVEMEDRALVRAALVLAACAALAAVITWGAK